MSFDTFVLILAGILAFAYVGGRLADALAQRGAAPEPPPAPVPAPEPSRDPRGAHPLLRTNGVGNGLPMDEGAQQLASDAIGTLVRFYLRTGGVARQWTLTGVRDDGDLVGDFEINVVCRPPAPPSSRN